MPSRKKSKAPSPESVAETPAKKRASVHAAALAGLSALSKEFVSQFDSGLDVRRVPTGFLSLDGITGGGILEGRFVEAWGDESSGKSTLGTQIAKSFVVSPGDVGLTLDYEHTLIPSYCETISGLPHVHLEKAEEWLRRHGVNHPPVMFWTQPPCAEDGADLLVKFSDLFRERLRFVLLDSLATMTPRAVMKKMFSDSTFAAQANFMTEFLQRLSKVFAERRTTMWGCNQDRANIGAIGPFAPKTRAAGARIIKFTASQRFRFSRAESSPWKTDVPGSHALFVEVQKNKTSPDRRGRTRLILWPGKGFSPELDLFDLAVEYDVLRSGGPGVVKLPNGAPCKKSWFVSMLTAGTDESRQLRALLEQRIKAAVPDGRYALRLDSKGD